MLTRTEHIYFRTNSLLSGEDHAYNIKHEKEYEGGIFL